MISFGALRPDSEVWTNDWKPRPMARLCSTRSCVSSALLQSLAAAGAPQDQRALVAAIRLGRELSPMQLLALALVGGFIAGKNSASEAIPEATRCFVTAHGS